MIAKLLQIPDKREKYETTQNVRESQEAVAKSVNKLYKFLDTKRLDMALIQEFKGLEHE